MGFWKELPKAMRGEIGLERSSMVPVCMMCVLALGWYSFYLELMTRMDER
jgi:hypothetical protein